MPDRTDFVTALVKKPRLDMSVLSMAIPERFSTSQSFDRLPIVVSWMNLGSHPCRPGGSPLAQKFRLT
jgi:hypothetical protein